VGADLALRLFGDCSEGGEGCSGSTDDAVRYSHDPLDAELLVDERMETAAALWTWIWANPSFAGCAIGTRNMLSDNDFCCR
jgi:hypothetical protein